MQSSPPHPTKEQKTKDIEAFSNSQPIKITLFGKGGKKGKIYIY
jgi:hypothetical protein